MKWTKEVEEEACKLAFARLRMYPKAFTDPVDGYDYLALALVHIEELKQEIERLKK